MSFNFISDTDFSYKLNNLINIKTERVNPNTKLTDSEKLLVVSYAWDGNALPGNEFWIGMLNSKRSCYSLLFSN